MALERLAIQIGACALLVLGAWLWHQSEVSNARQAGYDAAVEAGREQHRIDTAAALKTERESRERQRLKDEAAAKKEQQNDETLAAAQRRVRAGDDSLRIAIRTIRATAAPTDRPAAGGPAPDGPGESIVPTVAADILGLAADSGRLVRKYERLEARFEECRALNNGPVQEQPASSN